MRIVDDKETEEYEQYERERGRQYRMIIITVVLILVVLSVFYIWSVKDYDKKIEECKNDPVATFIQYSCDTPMECYEQCARDKSIVW